MFIFLASVFRVIVGIGFRVRGSVRVTVRRVSGVRVHG